MSKPEDTHIARLSGLVSGAPYSPLGRSLGTIPWPFAALANAALVLQFPIVHSLLLTHRGARWITNLREVRIAGKARVIRDAAISKRHAINGKEPLLALVIDVEEAFMHCSKSFIRTRLWHPDHWPERKSAPTLAEWVIATVDREQTLDEVREDHTADEGARLY